MGSVELPVPSGGIQAGTLLLGSSILGEVSSSKLKSQRQKGKVLLFPLPLLSRCVNPNRSCAKESPIKENFNKGLVCRHRQPCVYIVRKMCSLCWLLNFGKSTSSDELPLEISMDFPRTSPTDFLWKLNGTLHVGLFYTISLKFSANTCKRKGE